MTLTAEITHHEAGPIDGLGRERAAEWRVCVPFSGYATSHIPHDGSKTGKRDAHATALEVAALMMKGRING